MLQKGFLRSKIIFKKDLMITSILLWVITSIGLYVLFYSVREGLRISSILYPGKLLVIEAHRRYLFNLFFSSLAVSLAFLLSLRFLISSSQYFYDKRTRLKLRFVMNQIAYTSWNGLFMIGRSAVVFLLLFVSLYLHYDLDLIRDYPTILILPACWIFLVGWVEIKKVFIRRLTIPFLSFSTGAILLSIILAKVELHNYSQFDRNQISKQPGSSIKLPRTKYFQIHHFSNRVPELFVRYDSIQQKTLMFNNLGSKLTNETLLELLDPHPYSYEEAIRLFVDDKTPYDEIRRLQYILRKNKKTVLLYQVSPEHSRYPTDYPLFESAYISMRQPYYYPELINFLDSLENLPADGKKLRLVESLIYRNHRVERSSRVKVKISENEIHVNNKLFDNRGLANFLRDFQIKYADNYYLILETKSITFGRYIEIVDLIFCNTHLVRNKYVLDSIGTSYNKIEHRWAQRKYPLLLVEWTPEEKRIMALQEKFNE